MDCGQAGSVRTLDSCGSRRSCQEYDAENRLGTAERAVWSACDVLGAGPAKTPSEIKQDVGVGETPPIISHSSQACLARNSYFLTIPIASDAVPPSCDASEAFEAGAGDDFRGATALGRKPGHARQAWSAFPCHAVQRKVKPSVFDQILAFVATVNAKPFRLITFFRTKFQRTPGRQSRRND